VSSPTVEADEDAVRFILDHGGRFFVWTSDAGLLHADIKAHPGIQFEELSGDGFALFVDRQIEAANKWTLVFHRFPRPHLRALWNGGAFSPGSARIPSWECENPWE
jgi:hypothetical protein